MNTNNQSRDNELDPNADPDTSEVPELDGEFFVKAILAKAGEDLISVVRCERALVDGDSPSSSSA